MTIDDAGRLGLRSDNLTWREVGDEVVVLDLSSSTYLAVNGSGAVLWKALAEGASAGELQDTLMRQYDIEADTARRDVGAFLDDLRSRGLLA
jgi:hypothetical protein